MYSADVCFYRPIPCQCAYSHSASYLPRFQVFSTSNKQQNSSDLHGLQCSFSGGTKTPNLTLHSVLGGEEWEEGKGRGKRNEGCCCLLPPHLSKWRSCEAGVKTPSKTARVNIWFLGDWAHYSFFIWQQCSLQ